jgi:hypothetical protein
VRARGFHLIECAGQFIATCNPGHMRVLCTRQPRPTGFSA